MRFEDRRHAGTLLGEAVLANSPTDPVVYALPRGGVPVGFEVARALDCLLDVFSVAKVGLPSQPELAIGAVAEQDTTVANTELLSQLGMSDDEFAALAELARRRLQHEWRGEHDFVSAVDKTAVLVDDGLATGATASAAADVAVSLGASQVWLAVPVAPTKLPTGLENRLDRLVVLHRPRRFIAVGNWYRDFSQTSDDEVRELLAKSRLR